MCEVDLDVPPVLGSWSKRTSALIWNSRRELIGCVQRVNVSRFARGEDVVTTNGSAAPRLARVNECEGPKLRLTRQKRATHPTHLHTYAQH